MFANFRVFVLARVLHRTTAYSLYVMEPSHTWCVYIPLEKTKMYTIREVF